MEVLCGGQCVRSTGEVCISTEICAFDLLLVVWSDANNGISAYAVQCFLMRATNDLMMLGNIDVAESVCEVSVCNMLF